jgi:hypothetical protein
MVRVSALCVAQRAEFMQAGASLPTRSDPHPPTPSPQASLGGRGEVVFAWARVNLCQLPK